MTFTAIDQERFVCPSSNGGKNWPAGAYNPQSNVMFYPLQNMCMKAKTTTDKRDPARVYGLSMPFEMAPNTQNVGTVHAISVETGRTVWKHEQRAGMLSLVATGGGLVFGGDAAGTFMAFDEKTGKVLWETNLGSPVSGYPVAFAVNGKEYVAVSTGPSLVANSAQSADAGDQDRATRAICTCLHCRSSGPRSGLEVRWSVGDAPGRATPSRS